PVWVLLVFLFIPARYSSPHSRCCLCQWRTSGANYRCLNGAETEGARNGMMKAFSAKVPERSGSATNLYTKSPCSKEWGVRVRTKLWPPEPRRDTFSGEPFLIT